MRFMNRESQKGKFNPARVDMMFLLMEYDYLSKSESNWVERFKTYYQKHKDLSKVQYNTLEEIFTRAASRVEWSRFKK